MTLASKTIAVLNKPRMYQERSSDEFHELKFAKRVWADGEYEGNYGSFHRAIKSSMPDKQQPNHLVLGRSNCEYDDERPFTI